MFKGSSEHLQRAAVGRTTKNAGVDPTVWIEKGDEYQSLTTELVGLQAECAAINAQIAESRARLCNGAPGKPLPPVAFARVTRRKADIVKRIVAIENRLRPLKAEYKARRAKHFDSFADAFMNMAKEMLAHEVYDRIFVAAAHRMGPPAQ